MPRIEIDQARQIVIDNKEIAQVGPLRERAFEKRRAVDPQEQAVDRILNNRARNLEPFAEFFADITDPDTGDPTLAQLYENLLGGSFPGQYRRRNELVVEDDEFTTPLDITAPIFEAIFSDPSEELLKEWMFEVDTQVELSSQRNIEAIDAARLEGEVVKKDIVIVGGGPLTSVAASILGPYFDVTVVTEQNGIGKPWRNRPIYINSSADVKKLDGERLPLLAGTTTPTILSQQVNYLDTDVLLGGDTRDVTCDDGSTRQYVSGMRLGDLVATNIVFAARDYLINQTVDVEQTEVTNEGLNRLTITDKEGVSRQLDAKAVLFLTGPGKDTNKVTDPKAQKEYDAALLALDGELKRVREVVRVYQERSATGYVNIDDDLRDKLRQNPFVLPRVLSLNMIEDIYELWQTDLRSDPELFPLQDLVESRGNIAYLGNGDTSRTLKELVEGKGVERAYPEGIKKDRAVRATIYNEATKTPSEYDENNRRRYKGTLNPRTTTISSKASRFVTRSRGEQASSAVRVAYKNVLGNTNSREHAYAFVATGLERPSTKDELGANYDIKIVKDLEGKVVALGSEKYNVFVGGSATGFTGPAFPPQLRAIIGGLGISENTVSLWVHGLLVERLAWSLVEKLSTEAESQATSSQQ